jgi:hypothetical protein
MGLAEKLAAGTSALFCAALQDFCCMQRRAHALNPLGALL